MCKANSADKEEPDEIRKKNVQSANMSTSIFAGVKPKRKVSPGHDPHERVRNLARLYTPFSLINLRLYTSLFLRSARHFVYPHNVYLWLALAREREKAHARWLDNFAACLDWCADCSYVALQTVRDDHRERWEKLCCFTRSYARETLRLKKTKGGFRDARGGGCCYAGYLWSVYIKVRFI